MNRRTLLLSALGAALAARAKGASTMITRKIPSTGEELPAIGLGTWSTFDVDPAQRAPLRPVLEKFLAAGARVIDSSPMYGHSEEVVGKLLTDLGSPRPFLATKVWTQGREQGIAEMRASMAKMWPKATPPAFDLVQVHNLLDAATHIPVLKEWKAQGRIRYWGITHYQLGAFAELERIVRAEKPDFVQLPYSVGVREAEKRLLPACAEHGAAVLVMRPLEGGSLFGSVRKRPLPAWAAEIDCTSWAQIFLKWILGHPAVTCPIPATSKPEHLADDLQAGHGRLPDAALRARIVEELTR